MIFFRLLIIVVLIGLGYYIFRKLSATNNNSGTNKDKPNDRSPGGQAPLN